MKRVLGILLTLSIAAAAGVCALLVAQAGIKTFHAQAKAYGFDASVGRFRPGLSGMRYQDVLLRHEGPNSFFVTFSNVVARGWRTPDEITFTDGSFHFYGPWYAIPSGVVTRATLKADEGRMNFEAELVATDLTLDSRDIYERTVPFHRIRIEVKGTVDPAREVFTVQDGVLQIRGLSIPFSYARTLGSQPSREDFTARLDDATGPQLTASLPLVALPRLGMPKLDGTLSLSIIGHIDNERPEAAEVTARVRNRLIVNGLPEQFDTASLQKKFRIDVYDAAGGSKRYDLGPAMPDWVSATSAPPHLAAAILAAIDPLFGEHRGVSDLALSAVLTDLVKQRRRYGGYDTISQRVAATLWPMDRRDAVRNIELGLLATHLESNLGKDEILDLFLNIAPWNGGDYFGVRTACRMFFDKDLAELAPEESAFIAVALTAPDGSIMGERGIPKPDAIADAVDVLRALNRSELLPDESLRSAVKTLSEVGWPLRAVRSRDDETAPREGRRRPQ